MKLAQFIDNDSEGHPRSVHGNIQLPQHVRQRPDMVLMTVGQKNGSNTILVFDQILHVGNHIVDTGQVLIGERHPAIQDNDILATLDKGHILADLIQAAQGYDSDFFNFLQNSPPIVIQQFYVRSAGADRQSGFSPFNFLI